MLFLINRFFFDFYIPQTFLYVSYHVKKLRVWFNFSVRSVPWCILYIALIYESYMKTLTAI